MLFGKFRRPSLQRGVAAVCAVILAGCASGAAQSQEASEIEKEFWFLDDDVEVVATNFQNAGIEFHAAILTPKDRPARAGAIVIHGSGPTARSQSWAVLLSEILVHRGVAVLIHDKRGSGLTGGDWKESTFETRVQDELAALEHFRSQTLVDIPDDIVGVYGLSQGGYIAPEIANRMPGGAAFLITVSAATTSVREQMTLELANTHKYDEKIPEEYLAEFATLDELAFRVITEVSCADLGEGTCWSQYERKRDDLRKIDAVREVADGYPVTPDDWRFNFTRGIINYDPGEHWKKVDKSMPVYAAYGALDERDNVPVHESARRLREILDASGNKSYRVRIFERTGHAVRNHDTDNYEIHPELQKDLSRWIDGVLKGATAK